MENLRKNKNYRQQKGVTLIILVITIVVILILSSVTINTIFSENGVLNNTKDAQNKVNENIENSLTEEEKEIARRGRNTQTHHIAKNASMQDYMYATAFEALIGYLYLTKQDERLKEILNI